MLNFSGRWGGGFILCNSGGVEVLGGAGGFAILSEIINIVTYSYFYFLILIAIRSIDRYAVIYTDSKVGKLKQEHFVEKRGSISYLISSIACTK